MGRAKINTDERSPLFVNPIRVERAKIKARGRDRPRCMEIASVAARLAFEVV